MKANQTAICTTNQRNIFVFNNSFIDLQLKLHDNYNTYNLCTNPRINAKGTILALVLIYVCLNYILLVAQLLALTFIC